MIMTMEDAVQVHSLEAPLSPPFLLRNLNLWGEENKIFFFIRWWKSLPNKRVLKFLRENLKGKTQKKQ